MRSYSTLIAITWATYASFHHTASAIPTPSISSLDTALVILRDNDLWAQYSKRTAAAILVESPKKFSDAQAACLSLSEKLWAPDSQTQMFSAGLNNTLSYQIYLQKFPKDQLFWIAPDSQHSCRAISAKGVEVRAYNCQKKLPALCTHSAPIANKTFTDTSAPYRITVKSRKQHITGFRDSAGFRFDGIRFAPTPERFEYSTVLDGEGSVDALSFGAGCLQAAYGSEDCLFLNIATPYLPEDLDKCDDTRRRQIKAQLKPVMFYIYGGGFVENSGNLGNYDGVNLASRGDVVVVKINYRLGFFGWLALKTDKVTMKGNYGFSDMMSALKWVRANIAAFGGDPNRITVFGDSAGAISTEAFLASEKAKGLFSAAIIQSLPTLLAGPGGKQQFQTLEQATHTVGSLLKDTGCGSAVDTFACLKNANATQLLSIQDNLGARSIVVDGDFITKTHLPVTGNGYVAHVPLLMGANRDEAAISVSQSFASFTGNSSSIGDWLEWAAAQLIFGDAGPNRNLTQFANHPAFPHPSGSPEVVAFNITQRILSDISFRCGTWSTAYLAAKYRTLPEVYVYEMNRTYQPYRWTAPECEAPKNNLLRPIGDPNQEYYKCHSGEVDLIFGSLLWIGEEPRDEFDIPYSQMLGDHWTSFAWSHNPNPSTSYLKARGYWSTLEQLNKWGPWENLKAQNPTMRVLQWDGYQAPLSEKEQCAALGIPLDYLNI
ncbi:Acetylcholinesterase [Drechslerella dactyloides]|uniref:Acetylcholinesterase n=1 Tax=Drechslerella dactyloides TaxID=74499 RepID=A0AAD6NFE8_DREDA|nr:Acetylcholinesterase [Drechslerella dactyloides]